jgi:hypothetical protein
MASGRRSSRVRGGGVPMPITVMRRGPRRGMVPYPPVAAQVPLARFGTARTSWCLHDKGSHKGSWEMRYHVETQHLVPTPSMDHQM